MNNGSLFLEQELPRVIGCVTILGPNYIRFAGEQPIAVPAQSQVMAGYPTHPISHDPLVQTLQTILYNRCYCHRLEEPAGVPPEEDPELPVRLSQANASQEHWDAGWHVYQVGAGGQVLILKGDRQRSAIAGEYINMAPGAPVQVGSMVSVRLVADSFHLQPGFYWMYGETASDIWDEHALLRFYFNSAPDRIADVVDYMSSTLNRFQVPYRMKALTSAPHYTRTDSAVLYCARRYYSIVSRIIGHLSDRTGQPLGRSVPLFTKRLRDGVGLAEDPNTGESFGMNRCRLTAEGLVDAWKQGQRQLAGILAAIRTRFEMNGLKLKQPYLNAGSLDLFAPLLEKQAA